MSQPHQLTQHQIEKDYQALTVKYGSDQALAAANIINKDLQLALLLDKQSQSCEPAFTLMPRPAEIFLGNHAIIKRLESDNIRKLCLENQSLKNDAIATLDKAPLPQFYLEQLFASLAENRNNKPDLQLNNDIAFIQLLLRVPAHIAYFSWHNILQIFGQQKLPHIAAELSLASQHQKLRLEVMQQLEQNYTSCHKVYLAASKLLGKELSDLFPSAADKKLFIAKLQYPLAAQSFVSESIENSLFWVLNQAALLNLSASLSTLIIQITQQHPHQLDKILKDSFLLPSIPQKTLSRLLKLDNIDSTTRQNIVELLLINQDYIEQIDQELTKQLCHAATFEQFKLLINIPHIRHQLVNTAPPKSKDSSLHSLLTLQKTQADPLALAKINYLYDEQEQLLEHLSLASILDLATNKTLTINLTQDKLNHLLSRDALWQETPVTPLKGENLRGLTQQQFITFMQYDVCKEAWLRAIINDKVWDNLGQGFFSKKTPATIDKARKFISEKGEQPLEKEDLQFLLDLFKSASQNSHSYCCGLIELRSTSTQAFYDRVNFIPDVQGIVANAP